MPEYSFKLVSLILAVAGIAVLTYFSTSVATPPTTTTATTSTSTPSGYVLLVGGTDNIMETWSPSGSSPEYNPLPTIRGLWGSKSANNGKEFYTCGGGVSPIITECFTTTHGQQDWKPAPSLSEARTYHSLTAVGGVLVAAGGYDSGRNPRSVELLGPGDTAWTTADWSLQEEVSEHCAVALSDEELVILGGWTNSDDRTASVMKYHIKTGERSNLPSLPEPVVDPACAVVNNTIIVSGGVTGSSGINQVWELDLQTDKWKPLPSLQQPRSGHVMGLLGGRLHVFGGYGGERSVEVLNTSTDTWEVVEPGLEGRLEYGGAIFVEH